MDKLTKQSVIGVIGLGTMGVGITQLASSYGHDTVVFDAQAPVRQKIKAELAATFAKQIDKGRITKQQSDETLHRIGVASELQDFSKCDLIIEAVYENLEVKQNIFQSLESIVTKECVFATNTSSLPVSAIAFRCLIPERVVGAHFFNPAPIMPLVEIIPGVLTGLEYLEGVRDLINTWGKTTVIAKDTPGFIVNRIARPFYGEALRILEEGIADVATIDWAMKELGGFKMGPFELMDFIGSDINYKVTETVFEASYYDPRYRPSIVQKRFVEAGLFGRKAGRGFYNYLPGVKNQEPSCDAKLGTDIFLRILVMLINEAAEAVFLRIASVEDIDLAMTKGVNYPRGLLQWADEIGLEVVLRCLRELQDEYAEDRYRPSPLLKRMVRDGKRFYDIARC